MPQYYTILDNGVKTPKEKKMAKRRNQNRTYAAAKVNWRMKEGSNYYGDISGVKKKNPNPRTSGVVADRAGKARTSGRTADSYGRGARSSGKTPDMYGRKSPRTTGRTADSRSRTQGSANPRTRGRTADSYAGRVKTSRNYKKGLYR